MAFYERKVKDRPEVAKALSLQNKNFKNVTVEKLSSLFDKFKVEKYFQNLMSKVNKATQDKAGSLGFT